MEDGASELGKLRREGNEKRLKSSEAGVRKKEALFPLDMGFVRWGGRALCLRMSPLGNMDASTRPWETSRPKPRALMGMRNGFKCFLKLHALFSRGNHYNSESFFYRPSTLIVFTFIWGD